MSEFSRKVPVVVYKEGTKYVIGEVELRDTPDGLVATLELNEVLSAAPASPLSEDLGFAWPMLRANPYDPAIFGVGASEDGAKIISEIDRNARAYGWAVGVGMPLAMFIAPTNPDNPFLNSNWKEPLQQAQPDCTASQCGYQQPHKHGISCRHSCEICQGY